MILWKGHCSVHGRFSEDVVDELRAKHPGINILVHPECTHEVVLAADLVGSTEFIIKTIEAAEPGTVWAIGTELNLVQRLKDAHPDKTIVFLDRNVCYCSTMNRIDLPAPGLGPGEPRRRRGRQPDHRRPRDRGRRPGGAAADARPAGQVPPRLSDREPDGGCDGPEADQRLRAPEPHRRAPRALAPCTGSRTSCAVTRAMTVLHATEAATVHLAVAARAEGLTPDGRRHRALRRPGGRQAARDAAHPVRLPTRPAARSVGQRLGPGRHRGGHVASRRPSRLPASPTDGDAWLAAARTAALDRLADGPATVAELRARGPRAGRHDRRRHRQEVGPPGAGRPVGADPPRPRRRAPSRPQRGHWRLNKPTWTRTEDWLGAGARASRRGRGLRRARTRAGWGPSAPAPPPTSSGGSARPRRPSPARSPTWRRSRSRSTTARPAGCSPTTPTTPGRSSRGRPCCRRSTPPSWGGSRATSTSTLPTCPTSSTPTAMPAPPPGGTGGSWGAGCRTTPASYASRSCEDVAPAGRAALEQEAERLTTWLDGTVIGNVYASRQMKQAKLS